MRFIKIYCCLLLSTGLFTRGILITVKASCPGQTLAEMIISSTGYTPQSTVQSLDLALISCTKRARQPEGSSNGFQWLDG